MTPAEQALANAIHCEMVKCAYRQSKDGIVVSLVVHPDEVPAGLATSKLGTRYMVALVQIGDDELPVQQPAKETKKNAAPLPEPSSPARAKRDWREVQPSAQAALRCEQAPFWAFLREEYKHRVMSTDDAATAVRKICGVNSRAHFNDNHVARVAWHQLDSQFIAWERAQ